MKQNHEMELQTRLAEWRRAYRSALRRAIPSLCVASLVCAWLIPGLFAFVANDPSAPSVLVTALEQPFLVRFIACLLLGAIGVPFIARAALPPRPTAADVTIDAAVARARVRG